MVDDLHKKMLEYSIRENLEKKMRSIEWALEIAMELLIDVYSQFLKRYHRVQMSNILARLVKKNGYTYEGWFGRVWYIENWKTNPGLVEKDDVTDEGKEDF